MNYQSEESIERLDTIKNYLLYMDVDFEIDETIVRGLDYYDYNVWEYVTDDGVTLGGGGRYNSLVKTLDGPELPAVGFALGIERLMIELKIKRRNIQR
jgi:Histidyl-tRNA synthetase